MHILAVNCGSATIKYKLFDANREALTPLAAGLDELTGGYSAAIHRLLDSLPAKPDRIVHRVVHGGEAFAAPVWIDAHVRAAIADLAELAPLHNPPALEGIEACAKLHVPMVAVFDTGFHRTLPLHARTYALPVELARKHQIQRFGFHGISHQFVSERYAHLADEPKPSLISLHLGNGCSVTAIREGCSVETSMGFSPLEGLVMGTRSGDVDPGLLLHLMRHGFPAERLETLLNRESGLKGLAGSSDMRVLLARTDEAAKLAVEVFCHHVRKYIGSYLAVLEGRVDALVFTGGIGEHAAEIRARVCAGFDWAGLELDSERNRDADGKKGVPISQAGSPLQAWVIPTDEELQMARQAAAMPPPDRP